MMYRQQALVHSRNNYDANVCELFGIEFEPVIVPVPGECSESNKGQDLRRARLINVSTLKERHGIQEEEVMATPLSVHNDYSKIFCKGFSHTQIKKKYKITAVHAHFR